MKAYATIGLLILSNVFMTLAWYGHLKFKDLKWFENAGLITIVFISWDWLYLNIAFRFPQTELAMKVMAGPLI